MKMTRFKLKTATKTRSKFLFFSKFFSKIKQMQIQWVKKF